MVKIVFMIIELKNECLSLGFVVSLYEVEDEIDLMCLMKKQTCLEKLRSVVGGVLLSV